MSASPIPQDHDGRCPACEGEDCKGEAGPPEVGLAAHVLGSPRWMLFSAVVTETSRTMQDEGHTGARRRPLAVGGTDDDAAEHHGRDADRDDERPRSTSGPANSEE